MLISTSCESSGGFDDRVLNDACFDDAEGCPDWARKGECERNPEFMRASCRKSCYVCEAYVKVIVVFCAFDFVLRQSFL